MFSHAMAANPVVVDLGEVEMLEGLRERGFALLDIVDSWQNSSISSMALKNWIIINHADVSAPDRRPERMKAYVDAFFTEMIQRLALRPTPTPEEES